MKPGDWVKSKEGHGYYFKITRIENDQIYGDIYQPDGDYFWRDTWDATKRLKRFTPTEQQIMFYLERMLEE